MSDPRTEAGRASHDIAWAKDTGEHPITHAWERDRCHGCEYIIRIEAEAVAAWLRSPEAEEALARAIDERDAAIEWADRLAYAIAPVGVIGEHSNLNNPWQNALAHLRGESDG